MSRTELTTEHLVQCPRSVSWAQHMLVWNEMKNIGIVGFLVRQRLAVPCVITASSEGERTSLPSKATHDTRKYSRNTPRTRGRAHTSLLPGHIRTEDFQLGVQIVASC
jgi:hypothetical protein